MSDRAPVSDFEDSARRPPAAEEALVLDIEGYEGPIDLLLTLAREQKVDLTRISILQLADQYLAFMAAAREVRLELAADYLVMAAWLAYLKSRLLLPEPETEEPSGEELAAALAFQLQRLEAIQGVAARLMARPRLGRDRFPRGCPEELPLLQKRVIDVTLFDLLKAYGEHKRRLEVHHPFHIQPTDLYSVEQALERMTELLGRLPDWTTLAAFLPKDWRGDRMRARSALASTFLATLELAKDGKLEIRQDGTYGPLYLRRTPS